MELLVAGFGAGATSAEVWSIAISQAQRKNVICRVTQTAPDGIYWQGAGKSLSRLVRGIAPEVQQRLYEEGLPGEFVDSLTSFMPLWYSEMPIGDAVEVVRSLAATAKGFERYSPGLPLVAGPIDIAVITQNEGFKWVQRKKQVGRRQPVPGSFRIHLKEPAT